MQKKILYFLVICSVQMWAMDNNGGCRLELKEFYSSSDEVSTKISPVKKLRKKRDSPRSPEKDIQLIEEKMRVERDKKLYNYGLAMGICSATCVVSTYMTWHCNAGQDVCSPYVNNGSLYVAGVSLFGAMLFRP